MTVTAEQAKALLDAATQVRKVFCELPGWAKYQQWDGSTATRRLGDVERADMLLATPIMQALLGSAATVIELSERIDKVLAILDAEGDAPISRLHKARAALTQGGEQ